MSEREERELEEHSVSVARSFAVDVDQRARLLSFDIGSEAEVGVEGLVVVVVAVELVVADDTGGYNVDCYFESNSGSDFGPDSGSGFGSGSGFDSGFGRDFGFGDDLVESCSYIE